MRQQQVGSAERTMPLPARIGIPTPDPTGPTRPMWKPARSDAPTLADVNHWQFSKPSDRPRRRPLRTIIAIAKPTASIISGAIARPFQKEFLLMHEPRLWLGLWGDRILTTVVLGGALLTGGLVGADLMTHVLPLADPSALNGLLHDTVVIGGEFAPQPQIWLTAITTGGAAWLKRKLDGRRHRESYALRSGHVSAGEIGAPGVPTRPTTAAAISGGRDHQTPRPGNRTSNPRR